MLDVIGRGESALGEISALLIGGQTRHTAARLSATRLTRSSCLACRISSKILAIGRNYVDHAD